MLSPSVSLGHLRQEYKALLPSPDLIQPSDADKRLVTHLPAGRLVQADGNILVRFTHTHRQTDRQKTARAHKTDTREQPGPHRALKDHNSNQDVQDTSLSSRQPNKVSLHVWPLRLCRKPWHIRGGLRKTKASNGRLNKSFCKTAERKYGKF